jgi:hypothetical protein
VKQFGTRQFGLRQFSARHWRKAVDVAAPSAAIPTGGDDGPAQRRIDDDVFEIAIAIIMSGALDE